MNTTLTALEARIIGCLIEKQITTPDQYPLSLNALVNACNQKSNRDPVLDLDERTVQEAVDGLAKRHLVIEKSGFGSRVSKYHQIFCNAEFGSLKLSAVETAIVCELLLRGPQTPGELRNRANRMATIAAADDVERTLEQLATRAEGALVVRLPREPGRRESRYTQLFTGMPAVVDHDTSAAPRAASAPTPPSQGSLEARVAELEQALRDVRSEVAELREQLKGS